MRPRRAAWLAIFAALSALVTVLAWAPSARAHETRLAQIDIDALSPTDARVTLRTPLLANVVLEAPAGCRFDPPPAPSGVLRCRDGLAGKVIDVTGLGRDVDVAFVSMTGFDQTFDEVFDARASAQSAVVTKRVTHVTLPGAPSRSSVVTGYVRLGLEHVLSGLDHVLFLVALFWQGWSAARGHSDGSVRRAAWEVARTATAFTVAHSITLAATAFGVLHVPSGVAEACIAFSLVLVALDIGDGERPAPSSRARVALAAAFGLVHGLGFAGALAQTRLPAAAQWTALFAFNVGVEAGQLLLFAVCIAVVAALAHVRSERHHLVSRLATASAYVVGVAGATMFFLRVMSIFR